MVTINLSDPNVVENFKAIYELQKSGMYSDEEIQELYDKQVEADKENDKENDNG